MFSYADSQQQQQQDSHPGLPLSVNPNVKQPEGNKAGWSGRTGPAEMEKINIAPSSAKV
jgi:hypothetical protein